jgi:hypothetical protein
MKLFNWFKKIDIFLDKHTWLLLLFVLIIVLRLPNFFEPYWYGDEAIYLTLGTALREGGQLYTTIIDHKTPLIYYLAMVPNQFYFRILNLVDDHYHWLLFQFRQKIIQERKSSAASQFHFGYFHHFAMARRQHSQRRVVRHGFCHGGRSSFWQKLNLQEFFSKRNFFI